MSKIRYHVQSSRTNEMEITGRKTVGQLRHALDNINLDVVDAHAAILRNDKDLIIGRIMNVILESGDLVMFNTQEPDEYKKVRIQKEKDLRDAIHLAEEVGAAVGKMAESPRKVKGQMRVQGTGKKPDEAKLRKVVETFVNWLVENNVL